jgi:hypothetical protein
VAVARLQGGAAETACLEGRAARWRDAGGQGNAARGAARRDTTRRRRAGQSGGAGRRSTWEGAGVHRAARRRWRETGARWMGATLKGGAEERRMGMLEGDEDRAHTRLMCVGC